MTAQQNDLVRQEDGVFKFDGKNDGKNYVKLDSIDFNFKNYTIELWFASKKPGAILSATGEGGGHGILLEISGNPTDGTLNKARYLHRHNLGVSGGDNCFSSNIVTDGNMHYLVAVMRDNEMAIYLDGEKGTSKSISAKPLNQTLNVILGQLIPDAAMRQFTGQIGRVRIWKRAKTDAEILETFNAGFSEEPSHKITIYQHVNYGGFSDEITTPTPSLSTLDNQLSSCKVVGTWELFSEPDFKGKKYVIGPGDYKDHAALKTVSGETIPHDHISSLRPQQST